MASFDFTYSGDDLALAALRRLIGYRRLDAVVARYVAAALRDELPGLRRLMPAESGRLRASVRIGRQGVYTVIRARVHYASFVRFRRPTRLGTETVISTIRAWLRQGSIRFVIRDAMRRAVADLLAGRAR